MIVAVSFWVDEEGKDHPGFAHAIMVEDASAEAIDSVLKRLSLPEEEIRPLIEKYGQTVGVAIRPLRMNWVSSTIVNVAIAVVMEKKSCCQS